MAIACKTSAEIERHPEHPMKTQLLCAMLSSLSLSVPAFAAADFHDHLGIQMWSLRETAKEDPLKALDLVQGYGLKEIETAGLGSLTADQYAAELKARGLVAIATHAGYEALQKDLAGEIATANPRGTRVWCAADKDVLPSSSEVSPREPKQAFAGS
jgi:hypothetical protein